VLQLIQAGFTIFWTPVSYESYEKNPESKSLYEKTAASMCALMFTLSFLLIFSKDIIFLLFSPAYKTASHVFPFLLLVPIMYIVSEITVVGINFTKKTYWHLLIASVSSLIAIIGNWKLVPLYGAKGAAAAAAVSYTAFFYLRTIISKKLYPAEYGLLKFSLSTFIFILAAFLNTFSENMSFNLISAGIGMLFIILIYKDQIKDFYMIGKDLLSEKVFKRNMKKN
jgi:O-antigen/teichoic acid export membrane protein